MNSHFRVVKSKACRMQSIDFESFSISQAAYMRHNAISQIDANIGSQGTIGELILVNQDISGVNMAVSAPIAILPGDKLVDFSKISHRDFKYNYAVKLNT